MRRVLSIVVVTILVVGFAGIAADPDKVVGYDEFGYNYNARIFNGTMEQYYAKRNVDTPDNELGIMLKMKWSKNFVIQGQNENSWITNHYTWFTDDYENEATYYGYYDLNYGEGDFRVEEFIKIKSYGEVPPNVDELMVIWGNFVITMDHIEVYDAVTGELVDEFDISDKAHPGLGNMKF